MTDADSVRRCLPGHDVAFCTVGARNRGATTLYSTAARNLAAAMDDQLARRLVFLSNFGVLGEKPSDVRTAGILLFARLTLRPWLEDHRRALDELRKHDWEWIAVRPMRLTDGPRTSHYRVVMDGLPKGGTRISRADVADFMLKQLTSTEYSYRVVKGAAATSRRRLAETTSARVAGIGLPPNVDRVRAVRVLQRSAEHLSDCTELGWSRDPGDRSDRRNGRGPASLDHGTRA